MYFSILIVWPTIRLLGESAEHIYNSPPGGDRGRYLVGSTISNLGLLQTLLIHPHGDGMHLAHHLFPYVPGWHLRHLDAQLCRDAEIGALRRYRRRLWEEPRRRQAMS
jgi:fatty acid desaturase